MQLLRRGIRAGHPLLLVESDCIDDQRVAFPVPDGMTEKCRSQIVTRGMRTAIHVDHAPGVRACNVEDENTLELRCFDDFKTRRVEERGSRGWLAADERWIQIRSRRSILIQRSRPR